jgi:hypothetical protein
MRKMYYIALIQPQNEIVWFKVGVWKLKGMRKGAENNMQPIKKEDEIYIMLILLVCN